MSCCRFAYVCTFRVTRVNDQWRIHGGGGGGDGATAPPPWSDCEFWIFFALFL